MHSEVPPPVEHVAEFMTLVSDPARQPVYVHCTGGNHRTGAMTAVYRMEMDGWTADQAYQEMKRYGFGPSILHRKLKEFLYSYRPLGKYGPRPPR
jgi:tyrosine-protein phosphatase SIW14